MKNTFTILPFIIFLFISTLLAGAALPVVYAGNTSIGDVPNTICQSNDLLPASAFIDNGEEIVFVWGGNRIGVQFANGTGARPIFDVRTIGYGDVSSPVWSPDGSKIAFAAKNSINKKIDIYTINADGSNARLISSQLYTGILNAYVDNISWVAEGNGLVYIFTLQQGDLSNFSVPVVITSFPVVVDFSSNPIRETKGDINVNITSTEFDSFNGRTSYRLFNTQAKGLVNRTNTISVINLQNGQTENWFTYKGAHSKVYEVAWHSPNSFFILVEEGSGRTQQYHLMRIDRSSTGQTTYYEIINTPNKIHTFSLSPDKKEAYFSTREGDSNYLYRMSLDQQGNQIQNGRIGGGSSPNWRPRRNGAVSQPPTPTSSALAATQLLSPANNATFTQNFVDFSWTAVNGADSYLLAIVDVAGNVYTFPVSSTSYRLTHFPPGLWGWSVVGLKGTTEGAFPDLRIFTVEGNSLAGTSSSRARIPKKRTSSKPVNMEILREKINKQTKTNKVVVMDESGQVIKEMPVNRRSMNMSDLINKK